MKFGASETFVSIPSFSNSDSRPKTSAIKTKCPPAEKPIAPILFASIPYSEAFSRMIWFEHCGVMVAVSAHTIFQNEAADSFLRRPKRDILSFVENAEMMIASARADYQSSTRILSLRRVVVHFRGLAFHRRNAIPDFHCGRNDFWRRRSARNFCERCLRERENRSECENCFFEFVHWKSIAIFFEMGKAKFREVWHSRWLQKIIYSLAFLRNSDTMKTWLFKNRFHAQRCGAMP